MSREYLCVGCNQQVHEDLHIMVKGADGWSRSLCEDCADEAWSEQTVGISSTTNQEDE